MTTVKILVVDDEEYIRDLVSSALRIAGFESLVATDGSRALSSVAANDPDLVVLDVGLPGGIDGFEVCRRLRADGDETPVIFLTARDTNEDKVSGFTKGGDDYLTKPFSLEELVARVRAVLRRSQGTVDTTNRLSYADLDLDEDTMRVSRGGRPIQLSPTEFKLLRFLLINRERVLSKSQILDHVWQYDFGGSGGVVENYISYLRKKVDADGPPLIHTVRGFGYVLREEA
ncbi:MAG: two-component system, OmpR family, response regulator [Actinomycetota bacterium]|jgi:two-component system OmpR family response regulator|nr:two-component system, OmpR family, response regulator [Actinomycetota bacterium]